MSNPEKSRKPLIIGIIAAVVILGVLLTLVLTQCTGGGQDATQSTPVQTTPSTTSGEDVIPTYSLYWNLDRAQYDGKSEAGMSSRQPESDGFFHVRFFLDGEIVTLRVKERRVINTIDVMDVMDFVFDEDGIITAVVPLDNVPCDNLGGEYYVQGAAKTAIKLNSTREFDGVEMMFDVEEDTGIYDMTGREGDVGTPIIPIAGDKVIAVTDLSGKLTHVFVIDRPTYMATFKGECSHCKKTVEWVMFDRTQNLPVEGGHYQLQNDIKLTIQQNMKTDAKICLDLNGHSVDSAKNQRVYSLHNKGCQLVLMDTSKEQTGVLRGHGSVAQGGVVWVRYGAFYMYAGALDGRDVIATENGGVLRILAGAYGYMYGGTIYGANAKGFYKEESNKYLSGVAGSVAVNGKFVMHDGLITGGIAEGLVTKWDANGPVTYQRGNGGNVYVGSGAQFEMNGGVIENGKATVAGGNVYLDGTATMELNGGKITCGQTQGYKRNGGNIYITANATLTINGGYILDGIARNSGGNIYSNGTVIMNGGFISGGRIMDWRTGALNSTEAGSNIFNVNGKFTMYGGVIHGGFSNTDSKADKVQATVTLGGLAQITSEGREKYPDLTLNTAGDNVKVVVLKLAKGAKIGVNTSSGIFTTETNEANLDKFYSNVEGTEICYHEGCLAVGKMACACGLDANGKHIGDCDGTEMFWVPVRTNTIPSGEGNYYLLKNVNLSKQYEVKANTTVRLDLNGYILNGAANKRVLTTFGENAYLSITDSSAEKTGRIRATGKGDIQGNVLWIRFGTAVVYQGILDGSGFTLNNGWDKGADGVYGTADDKDAARDGGTIFMSYDTTYKKVNTFTMYGGEIIGSKLASGEMTATQTNEAGEKVTLKRVCGAPRGAAMGISAHCVVNIHGGLIRDGKNAENVGGNILVSGDYSENGKDITVVNLYGGTIKNGTATLGGNLYIIRGATVNMYKDFNIEGGTASGNGSSIYLDTDRTLKPKFNMEGGSITGGDLFVGAATLELKGGKIADSVVTVDNEAAALNLDSVNISGSVVVNKAASVKLSGKPVIKSNNGISLSVASGLLVDISGLNVSTESGKDEAQIGVTGVGQFTSAATEAQAKYFFSDSDQKLVSFKEDALWLVGAPRYYCLCGKTEAHADTTAVNGCNGQILTWIEWARPDSLPKDTNNYYLACDVELDTFADFDKADQIINIDLNGYSIKNKTTDQAIRLIRFGNTQKGNNVRLTFVDTVGTGVISTDAKYDQGAIIWANAENCVITFISGTIDASKLTVRMDPENPTAPKNVFGANAIALEGKNNSFVMYGGTFIGGNTMYGGDAVYGNKYSTIAIHGGTIQASQNSITDVVIRSFGTTAIDGGTIDGVVEINSKDSNGTLTLSGSPAIKEIYLSKTANYTTDPAANPVLPVITVDGTLDNTAPISVRTMNGMAGFITGETVEANLAKFKASNVMLKTEWDGVANKIALVDAGIEHTSHDGWTKLTNGTTTLDAGMYYLDGDLQASITASGAKVVICLNGHNWTGSNGRPLTVTEGNVFLCDCTTQGNGKVHGFAQAEQGSAIHAASGSAVYLLSGAVNKGEANCEAIYMADGASLTVNDAVVTGGIKLAGTNAINLSGNPQVDVLDLGTNNLTLGELAATARVGVTADSARVILGGTVAYANKDIFSSNDYLVAVTANGMELMAKDTHVHCVCAGTLGNADNGYQVVLPDNTVHTCVDIVFNPYTGSAVSGNWYLADDVVAAGQTNIKNANINLCLNGHNWLGAESKRVLALFEGTSTTLSITTCQADVLDGSNNPTNNRVVATGTNTQGGVVWVRYGTLNLYAGHLDGTNYTASYGGVVCVDSNQTFNMYGGTLQGAHATQNGAALFISGTMNLYNGVVKAGNADQKSGNICLRGTLNMHGGLITGGKVNGTEDDPTANIGLEKNTAKLNMTGGQIDGRISSKNKGAVVAISGDAKIPYTGSKNRLIIEDSGDGTPMLSLVIGDLSDEADIQITNLMKSGANFTGKFATAASGYTITEQDLAQIGVHYDGDTGALYEVVLEDNAVYFAAK